MKFIHDNTFSRFIKLVKIEYILKENDFVPLIMELAKKLKNSWFKKHQKIRGFYHPALKSS